MIISVIVPVRNDRRIEECLNSLIHQDFPRDQYEILVVDNGSTDPEIPQIIQKFPVRYISEPRIGSYTARNSGIDQASGGILAFTDSDCILPATWLPKIKEHFEKKCAYAWMRSSQHITASDAPPPQSASNCDRWNALARWCQPGVRVLRNPGNLPSLNARQTTVEAPVAVVRDQNERCCVASRP